MMSHTSNKSYNLVNHEETKALLRQIKSKSILTYKSYAISTLLLIEKLKSISVKNIKLFNKQYLSSPHGYFAEEFEQDNTQLDHLFKQKPIALAVGHLTGIGNTYANTLFINKE